MIAWTLLFHLIGLVFWMGSLLTVTHVLAIHTEEESPTARQALGRLEMKIFKGLAHPGAALMVLTGGILISTNPAYYLHAHWLHAKLALVATLIALDLRTYFRTKAFQAGKIEMRRGECKVLHGAIAFVFFGILILVLTKPFEGKRRAATLGSAAPCHPAVLLKTRNSRDGNTRCCKEAKFFGSSPQYIELLKMEATIGGDLGLWQLKATGSRSDDNRQQRRDA
jgi:protoporphyrinogen IX oxidase